MRGCLVLAGLLLLAGACGGDSADEPVPTSLDARAGPSMTATPACTAVPYTVEPGDTLSDIAVRFDVDLDRLIAANGITNANLLTAGQKLNIPCRAQTPSPSASP